MRAGVAATEACICTSSLDDRGLLTNGLGVSSTED